MRQLETIRPIYCTIRGQFVQLDDYETEYVVLSPEGLSVFHANIVERFCVLNDIKGHYNAQFNLFTIDYSDIEIVGGGFWEIDENKEVTLPVRYVPSLRPVPDNKFKGKSTWIL